LIDEEFVKIRRGFPNWSKNGDYVYFLHEGNDSAVMRVRVSDHKVERVADLKNFRQAGFFYIWLGLAPTTLGYSSATPAARKSTP
jgi:hypothetical protein